MMNRGHALPYRGRKTLAEGPTTPAMATQQSLMRHGPEDMIGQTMACPCQGANFGQQSAGSR